MSGIELRTKIFPLAFLLLIFPPSVSINGSPPLKITWGVNPLPLPPGRYQISVWFKYVFMDANKADIVVDVPAGGMVPVTYKSRWLVFLPGKIAVDGPPMAVPAAAGPPPGVGAPAAVPVAAGAPAGSPPPGWQPDPTGRFEQRYWDGAAWTPNVSRGGVTSTDPV